MPLFVSLQHLIWNIVILESANRELIGPLSVSESVLISSCIFKLWTGVPEGPSSFLYCFRSCKCIVILVAPEEISRVHLQSNAATPSVSLQVLERTRQERKRRQQQKLEQKSALQVQVHMLRAWKKRT